MAVIIVAVYVSPVGKTRVKVDYQRETELRRKHRNGSFDVVDVNAHQDSIVWYVFMMIVVVLPLVAALVAIIIIRRRNGGSTVTGHLMLLMSTPSRTPSFGMYK